METKNFKINVKKTDKNIYLDPFLKRKIGLSDSPYKIFLEIQKNPKKFIALRESFIPTLYKKENSKKKIPPTAQKPTQNQANEDNETAENLEDNVSFEEGLSQSLFEEESNENEYENLNFAKNKYGFTKNSFKNQNISDSHQFDKSKSSLFKSIFDSNLLWSFISFILLLSCILFYFQGLQPLILTRYSEQTQKQLIRLNSRFFEQIDGFSATQNVILNRFNSDSSLLCSKTPLYQEATSDSDSLSRLQTKIFPDKRLEKLPNYNVFYQKDIKDIYDKNYQNYKDTLGVFNTPIENLENLLKFLSYRNSWITACRKIEVANSSKNLVQTQEACTELTQSHKDYINIQNSDNSLPSFWGEIDQDIERAIGLCKGVLTNNINSFFVGWFSVYSKVIVAKPDLDNSNKEIQEKSQNFDLQVKTSVREILKINNSKNDFSEIWYLLSIQR